MKVERLLTAIDSLLNRLGSVEFRDSDAAIAYSRRVEGAVGQPMSRPLLGRSGRRPGTRERVASGTPFLIVCRVEGDLITVLRLFHRAQDWPNMP